MSDWVFEFFGGYVIFEKKKKKKQTKPKFQNQVSRESITPHPLARLHENDLQDSFCISLWKKLGFSLVISEYALKYAGLDSSICSQKKYQNNTSDDVAQCHPDFKIFPGEHAHGLP